MCSSDLLIAFHCFLIMLSILVLHRLKIVVLHLFLLISCLLSLSLVEIDKTGNLTSTQLKELGENSFDNASKWGSIVQDYMSSSETFAQAGFDNLEEIVFRQVFFPKIGKKNSQL